MISNDEFGFGQCTVVLCTQAAVNGSRLCRYHAKLAAGMTGRPGRESDALTRVPKDKVKR